MLDREPTSETGRRFRRGEPGALRELVEYSSRAVYALVFRMVLRHEAAEDILQETYLRCWKARGKFDQERPFMPWVKRIACNLALTHLRSRKKNGPNQRLAENEWDLPVRAGEEPVEARFYAGGNLVLAVVENGLKFESLRF